MLTRRGLVAGASLTVLAGSSRGALAQAYPSQTIRIIAGFPAGGGIDISARLLVDPMKDALGQPVIVENRTGAAGMIAANAVAKAPPDGHMHADGDLGRDRHQPPSLQGEDDLRSAARACADRAGRHRAMRRGGGRRHAGRTPQELIAYAKANAGKLSFSSSGVGNPQQLAGELMNIMAGTDVLHVPYRGAAPAVTDVATGAVTMSFTSLAAAPRPDPGRQGARGRGDLARAHAAIAGRRAAAGGLAGACRATSCSTGSRCSRPAARRRRSSGGSTRSPTRRLPGAEDRRDAGRAGHRRARR